MMTLVLMYLTASYTYTYMLAEKQEGKARYVSLQEKHGKYWWSYFMVTAPIVFGKRSFEVVQILPKMVYASVKKVLKEV